MCDSPMPSGVAVDAMLRMRDAAAQVLAGVRDATPVPPHHLMVLRTIDGGAATVSEVAVGMCRHTSSASRVVDQMVGLGLVGRERHPEDRRQVRLTLTDEGERTLRSFERVDRALSSLILAEFDAEDAQRLAGYMDRMAAAATSLAARLEEDPDLLDRLD